MIRAVYAFIAICAVLAPLPSAAQDRLVVIGASLVEIVYALGAGDRVIAIDQTATYPPEAQSARNVGYFRRVSAEGVLALRPDMVLAAADAGPPESFEAVAAASIPVLRAPDTDTPEGVPDKIAFIGAALNMPEAADALAAEYSAALQTAGAQKVVPRSVLFVMTIEGSNPLVAGRDTAPDTMIRAAGLQNVAKNMTGYKSIGPEALIALAPDAVLMMPPHAARVGGLETVMGMVGFAQTPAASDQRYATMEGTLLMRFGPRTPAAVSILAEQFGGPETAPQ